MNFNRRRFGKRLGLFGASTVAGATYSSHRCAQAVCQAAGQAEETPSSGSLRFELPRGRVPLSFIIDDSTCLVNMGKFCMPQFAATYPQRKDYQRPWQSWPDEIPDAFVREFGEWCAEYGVKGKYSIVPYPACVGWLDRVVPGWSRKQLKESLRLVRDLMTPNWDIHPEMITHTRVIDLKTGRPFADFSPRHMENSYPQEDVSVDYLAEYLAYALRILKNCDLPCEGVTTPGGFGNQVKGKLPQAVFEAVRDVFAVEVPHYFKYVVSGDETTVPKIEYRESGGASSKGLPEFVVNVPAGTGDWFGGWDGSLESSAEKYSDRDATTGRMVELIERGEPAVMLCHWPGMYCNGSKSGFRAFQRVVKSLHDRFDSETLWMKVSEIAHYWAARECCSVATGVGMYRLSSPLACSDYTVSFEGLWDSVEAEHVQGASSPERLTLQRTAGREDLRAGRFCHSGDRTWVCLDLQAGTTVLRQV